MSPNTPKTPLKSFRIPEDRYQSAKAKAEANGTDLSKIINAYLERYIKRQ